MNWAKKIKYSALLLIFTPLILPTTLLARTTDEAATDDDKKIDELIAKIEALNIDTAPPTASMDTETSSFPGQRPSGIPPASTDVKTTEAALSAAAGPSEEEEIATILKRIEALDPLKNASAEECPQHTGETTTKGDEKTGIDDKEGEGKDAKEAKTDDGDSEDKKDDGVSGSDEETQEGSTTDRARLYAEITDRLTRIVEKLTAIVDFLNKTFAAIAQQNGAAVPQLASPEDLQAEKARLEEKDKADKEKLEELKVKAKEKELEEKARKEKEEKEKKKKEEAAKSAKEEDDRKKREEVEKAAKAPEEGSDGFGAQQGGTASGGTLEQIRDEISKTEKAIDDNREKIAEVDQAIARTTAEVAANHAEWELLLERVRRMDKKLVDYLRAADEIPDATKKAEVGARLNEVRALFVVILSRDASKLNAADIQIVKEWVDDVEKELRQLEEDLEKLKVSDEDSKKKE